MGLVPPLYAFGPFGGKCVRICAEVAKTRAKSWFGVTAVQQLSVKVSP
jgi:hypothetical protein